jgi:hypothetical protein
MGVHLLLKPVLIRYDIPGIKRVCSSNISSCSTCVLRRAWSSPRMRLIGTATQDLRQCDPYTTTSAVFNQPLTLRFTASWLLQINSSGAWYSAYSIWLLHCDSRFSLLSSFCVINTVITAEHNPWPKALYCLTEVSSRYCNWRGIANGTKVLDVTL